MSNKTKHLIGFILNLIGLIAEVFIIVSFFVFKDIVATDVTSAHTLLFYFTVIAILGSLLGTISSLISFITLKENTKICSTIRSISVTSLFFVTIFEFISISLVDANKLLSPFVIILTLCLIINAISHFGFEPSYKQNALIGGFAGVFALVYCVASLLFQGTVSGWDMYPFEMFGTSQVAKILTALAYVLIVFVFGIVVFAINNIGSKPDIVILSDVEIEPVTYNKSIVSFTATEELVEGPEDDSVKNEKHNAVVIEEADEESEELEEIKERKQAKIDKKNNYSERPGVYHISKQHISGKWQVKLASGKKAIKLFETQALAIQYAKTLVETQGGSIRIHSLKGKLRKE